MTTPAVDSTALPDVSVVLPAYNVREHIGEAIDSVLAQGIEAMEIIVVDDGSHDGTADFVAEHYPAVRLYRKANGGAATARNLGMQQARGRYVAFLDADDVWLPGKLRIQLGYLEQHPDLRLVCGGFSFWLPDDSGSFTDPAAAYPAITTAAPEPEHSGWLYHKLLLANFVWTSTVVMRRSLIEEIGLYDESLRLGQDYDYWLRASRVTPIHRLGGVMALYRKHDNSATMRGNSQVNHAARVLRSAVARWGLASPDGMAISERALCDRLYQIHFSAGFGCYRNGRYQRAVREFRECLRERPLCFKSWAYLLLSAVGVAVSKLRPGQAPR
jgi:glycosyltransferase involved in cell wall biosynthesis